MDDSFQEFAVSEDSESEPAHELFEDSNRQKALADQTTHCPVPPQQSRQPEQQDELNDVSGAEWKALLSNGEMLLVSADRSGEDLWTGLRIGDHERYLVREQIGTGGMGTVYLALDQKLNPAPVATKVPRRKYLIPGVSSELLLLQPCC